MVNAKTSPQRFLPSCTTWRRDQIAVLASVVPAALIAALVMSHLDTHLALGLWHLGGHGIQVLTGVEAVLAGWIPSASVLASFSHLAAASTIAAAVCLTNRPRRVALDDAGVSPDQPIPAVSHVRATVRERHAHRRAIHIVTTRNASKGDGHAASVLIYTPAAITA